MLRPVPMMRMEIGAMKEFKDEVIKRLHELGVIQIMEYKGTGETEAPLRTMPVDVAVKETTKLIRELGEVIGVYEEVAPTPKESMVKRMFNPSPPKRIELGSLKAQKKEEVIKRAEVLLQEVKGEIEGTLKVYRELEVAINELKSAQISMERIKELDVELKYVGEGYYITIFIGFCTAEALETVISDLKDVTSGLYYLEQVKSGEEEYACLIACFNQVVEDVLTRLRRVGFERIDLDFEKKPKEEIEELARRITEKELEREAARSILAESAAKRRDELLAYRAVLEILEERGEIQRSFGETDRTFLLRGWIPAEQEAEISREVKRICNDLCVIQAVAPDPEERAVPVLLRNPKFFKNFEILTRLYGIPKYNGIDPTILLTPTFIFFFALMLADAVYGLICVIFGILLFRGMGKYNEMVKDASIILISVGIATSIIGAVMGGWFGDFFIKYLHITSLNAIILLDPMGEDVGLFLLLVLVIGVIHIDIGIITKILDDITRNRLKDALKGDLWFLLAQPGGHTFVVRSTGQGTTGSYSLAQMIGLLILVVSVILLVWGRKTMFFFGITGAIGDTLSYARLMALSLCTFGIAMTINILADLAPLVLAVVIFIFGHTVNFGINILGSFVHGIRLHYVEFFTKFYESGGDTFAPFREGKSVIFK
ncbi:MAG: V-type ATP synthase subunit I [Methanophagales archaeon ANME-1-THS]|nr:MAG: V-type ATP synthase subunit I [Methanophagales archaeon ANME-1-THS]